MSCHGYRTQTMLSNTLITLKDPPKDEHLFVHKNAVLPTNDLHINCVHNMKKILTFCDSEIEP